MFKRLALTLTATAMLAIPATGAAAVPEANDEGQPLPAEACFAVIPQTAQPLLCGYDNGGWPADGIF